MPKSPTKEAPANAPPAAPPGTVSAWEIDREVVFGFGLIVLGVALAYFFLPIVGALVRIVLRAVSLAWKIPLFVVKHSFWICQAAHRDGWTCTLKGEKCFSGNLGLFGVWLAAAAAVGLLAAGYLVAKWEQWEELARMEKIGRHTAN